MSGQRVRIVFVLASFFILALTACQNSDRQTLQPLEAVKISKDLQYVDQIPAEIPVLISKLDFKPEDKHKDYEGAYPVDLKIKGFGISTYVKYSDGWIIGSGRGEWGGILYWLGNDGTYKVIKDDDLSYPIDVEVLGGKIVFAQGMSHMSIHDGHVLEITRDGGTFKTKSFPVDGYPSKFSSLEDDLILVVSKWTTKGRTNGFYKVRELLAGKTERYSSD